MQTPTSPLRQSYSQNLNQNCLDEPSSKYKRSADPNSQSDRYNTKRKYNDYSMSNTDQDSTVKSIKSSEREDNNNFCDDDSDFYQPDLSVIQEQQSVTSSLHLREKYKNLLVSDYLKANFSLDQIRIIQMQSKLDELLDYLRQTRNKQKGQLFSQIKRCMRNDDIQFELDNLRQILFIKPDFYIWAEKRDQRGRLDLLISLPEGVELPERRDEFRKGMYEYLSKNQGLNNQKKLRIPYFNFPFITKQEEKNKQGVINNININTFWQSRSSSMNKINPFDALKPGNSQNFQEMLMAKIRQNEQRIKAEKQKEKVIKFGNKQLLTVFDEIPKIYKKREKNSMFKSSIIQDLDKSLNLKQQVLCKIFEVLLEKYPTFFKVIEHKSGDIIQIQRKIYNEIRILIQKDQEIENKNVQNLTPVKNIDEVKQIQTPKINKQKRAHSEKKKNEKSSVK